MAAQFFTVQRFVEVKEAPKRPRLVRTPPVGATQVVERWDGARWIEVRQRWDGERFRDLERELSKARS